jgi:hypothetical protein
MSENEAPAQPSAPSPPPSSQPPPYASRPAPYRAVSAEQRDIWETKGRRGIGFGVAWLVGGLFVTLITYSNASGGGVYVVAWGPALYGVYRIVAGYRLLAKSRS